MKCWLYLVESFFAMWLAVLDRTVALLDISPYNPYFIKKGLDHLIKVWESPCFQDSSQYSAEENWNPHGRHPSFPWTQ